MSTQPVGRVSYDTWVPGADGAMHEVRQPFGFTLVRTARVQNLTAGELRVRRGQDTPATADAFDWIVPPRSSETIALDDVGLTYYWTGLPTTDDKVVTALSADQAAPTGSSIGAPQVPRRLEQRSWGVPAIGGQLDVTDFAGGTIMSARVENKTPWHLIVRSGDAAGLLLGLLPPFSYRVFVVGNAAMFLSTKGPNLSTGGSDNYVTIILSDIAEADVGPVPYGDPLHAPGGTLLQKVASGTFNGAIIAAQTIATIPVGKTWVIHQLDLELTVAKAAAGAFGYSVLGQITRGLGGSAGAQTLVTAAAAIEPAAPAAAIDHGRASLRGPLLAVAQAATGPNLIQIFTPSAAGALAFWGSYNLVAWEIADIQ